MGIALRLLAPSLLLPLVLAAQPAATPKADRLKAELARSIDAKSKLAQQMVDQVFSFGELGMQEIETSKYLTGVLERNGFTIERGVAGIPTAWVARWGKGSPVISLGSDIDGIPQSSQNPARPRATGSLPARLATAKDTTAASRSTSSRHWQSRTS